MGNRWDLESSVSSLYVSSCGMLQMHISVRQSCCYHTSSVNYQNYKHERPLICTPCLSQVFKILIISLFQQSVEGIPALNLPDVCTMSPERGKAFCRQHCELLQIDTPEVPLGLKDFLKFCGVHAGNPCLSVHVIAYHSVPQILPPCL